MFWIQSDDIACGTKLFYEEVCTAEIEFLRRDQTWVRDEIPDWAEIPPDAQEDETQDMMDFERDMRTVLGALSE